MRGFASAGQQDISKAKVAFEAHEDCTAMWAEGQPVASAMKTLLLPALPVGSCIK